MRQFRAGHNKVMEETLAILAASGSGGGGGGGGLGYAFVFRPGGVTNENVFATWPALVAAVNAVQGPKLVEIDTSIAPAIVPVAGMPAAGWNLSDWTLQGLGFNTLTFAAGALIDPATTQLTVTNGLAVTNTGTVVLTTTAANAPFLLIEADAVVNGTPGAPFIDIPAGTTLLLFAIDAGGVGDGVNAAINVAAGGTLDAGLAASGTFVAHAFSGAGTFNLTISAAATLEYPQGLVPTSLTYVDPPQNIGETNAGPLTAGPVVFTSTGTLQRAASGKVQGSACASVTGAAAGAPVIFSVLRNPGGVVVSTQTVDGGTTHTQCTLTVFDTLPDFATHTYAIEAAQAATALTIAAGQARIALNELT